jgi:hypothetical protein
VVAEGPAVDTVLHWPGEEPRTVDFVREADRPIPTADRR